MNNKIKTIKEFIFDGPPQFDIILRRKKGNSVTYNMSFALNVDKSFKQETLFPVDSQTGIIQIVKRISDDSIFHQFVFVKTKNDSNCFIVEFNEDLVHCVILCENDDKKIVEMNDLKKIPDVDIE